MAVDFALVSKANLTANAQSAARFSDGIRDGRGGHLSRYSTGGTSDRFVFALRGF